jgi:hypothetical protein
MFARLHAVVWRGCIPAVLLLCCAAVLLIPVRPALAQSSSPWTVQETTPSLKTPLSYVLWIKSGATDSQGNYSGDMASIWTVDATGHQMAVSPTYGPYPGWRAYELVPAFDGTLRMAWIMDGGSTNATYQSILSFWTLDSSGKRMSVSPTYGPYTGWQFFECFPNPDGTTALYWAKSTQDSSGNDNGNLLSIWTVDSVGSQLSVSATYGPYPGWYFREGIPSFNKDGTSYVVWTNEGTTDSSGDNYTGDQISVWKTDSRGKQLSIGPTYGRYPGWQFNELYPAYDGTARLLWTLSGTTDNNYNYNGDTASIWSMDSTGHQTTVSPTYGPYPGWTINSLITAPSSTSRLLWMHSGTTDSSGNYSGDLASIWSLNAADVQTSISPTYSAGAGTVLDSLFVMSDGSERLTWELGGNSSNDDYASTQFLEWSLDATNNRTATGPVYGPYL